eukprot:TRINITY_DN1207_c0_g2_i1.p1 TRINITY_DN1207_c0_g2~~TRINITY_DN1207_c0_g2_i1.p1  ORF type:complete len:431 (+),score=86.79 TRINITY_DN1207_c0_g2_i1:104-1396(+)
MKLVLLLVVCLIACCFAVDQVHVARTSKPSEMVISWFSYDGISSATVEYYSHPAKILSAKAESASYYTKAFTHHALLEHLAENTRYHYRCKTVSSWTEWSYFTTPNASFTHAFQIPVYGDMGVTNSQNTINQIEKLITKNRNNELSENIPFILHVGDISYADDRNSDEYEKIWDQWFAMMENVTRYIPYMVNPGNHEIEAGKPILPYSQFFVDYNYRFKMPLAGSLTPYYERPHNMWWSMDHQNVHFIALSSETDFEKSPFAPKFGNQLAWLKEDLIKAHANRKNVPWIIAMGHRPLYSSASGSYVQDMLPILRAAFEDLFHEFKVDMYLCGHVHAYERTWPVYRNQTVQKNYNDPQALVTLTAGAAGDIEGMSNGWLDPIPDWSVLHNGIRETYGMLHIVSDTELKWELFDSKTNGVVDQFTLTKKPVV